MGGDIADIFTVSNSVDINKLQQMQRAQMKMAELRERSEDIAKSTGKKPLGYFAFERLYPTRVERTKNGLLGGALVGAISGAAIAVIARDYRTASLSSTLLTGSVIGAIPGALIGAYTNESEESRVDRSLKKYEAYIVGLEIGSGEQKAGPATSLRALEGYAKTIEGERAQPSEKAL